MFNWFRKRPVRSEETPRPDKAPKSKTFKFATISVEKMGDVYLYEITAPDREEAQRKIINYFYGNCGMDPDIKSDHRTIVYSNHSRESDVFENTLFKDSDAYKFAKCLGGVRCDKGFDYKQWLRAKAASLGIVLKEGKYDQ